MCPQDLNLAFQTLNYQEEKREREREIQWAITISHIGALFPSPQGKVETLKSESLLLLCAH